VSAADGGVDVARGARDGTDEGGAQDTGKGGAQSESSGSPGSPKTPVAAADFDNRTDAPTAAVHAANIGPGGRRLARDR